MGRFALVLTLCSLCLICACAPVTKKAEISPHAAAQEVEKQRFLFVEEQAQLHEKLFNVSWPLLEANTALCAPRNTWKIGIGYASLDGVGKEWRQAYHQMGVRDQLTVYTVAAGSNAAKAGIQRGDMIMAVNGKSLPSGRQGAQEWKAMLASNKAAGAPIRLSLDSGTQTREVTINPHHVCDMEVLMNNDDELNAYADGKNIVVLSGMLRTFDDKQLAAIIGHEMAHNAMGHIDKKTGNAMIGSVFDLAFLLVGVNTGNAFGNMTAQINSVDFENEADYVGTYAIARAGYDITRAPDIWRTIAARYGGKSISRSSSHPATAERFLAIEQHVQEILDKKAKGLPLDVEMRQQTAQRSQETEAESAYRPVDGK